MQHSVITVVFTIEVICLFSRVGVTRASDKNIHNFFCISYFVYGITFCCIAKIIGSLGKNDSLLFH